MFRLKAAHLLLGVIVALMVYTLSRGAAPVLAAGAVTDCSKFGPGAGTLATALAGGGYIGIECSGTIVVPEIAITVPTIIAAPGQTVTISGGLQNRVFNVNAGASLTLQHITVAYGYAFAPGGGAVLNNGGTVTINGSAFVGNQGIDGGAIHSTTGSTTTIFNSTFSQNRTISSGGGGAIYNDGGTVTITNVTISENRAYIGGGINNTSGTMTIKNSVVALNTWLSDCFNAGTFAGSTSNRASDTSCPGFVRLGAEDLQLGQLQGNPAFYPLLGGSDLIDRGSDIVCVEAPINGIDQRGLIRPWDGNNDKRAACDIGASEFVWPTPPVPLCADMGGKTNPNVMAEFPSGSHGIHCRVLVENGNFIEPQSAIGNQAVLDQTIFHAVDVFSLYGAQADGSKVCLYGDGGFLFMNAVGQPRAPQVLAATDEGGYSCAIIPDEGTLVLISDTTGFPSFVPLPYTLPETQAAAPDVVVELSTCKVTTNAMLNLRREPSLNSEVITILPYELTLTATGRNSSWFRVVYDDFQAWVSADWVATRGNCG